MVVITHSWTAVPEEIWSVWGLGEEIIYRIRDKARKNLQISRPCFGPFQTITHANSGVHCGDLCISVTGEFIRK
jgi:hypothetical protein